MKWRDEDRGPKTNNKTVKMQKLNLTEPRFGSAVALSKLLEQAVLSTS